MVLSSHIGEKGELLQRDKGTKRQRREILVFVSLFLCAFVMSSYRSSMQMETAVTSPKFPATSTATALKS